MEKTKVIIIIGCVIIAVGMLLYFIGFAMDGFEFDVASFGGNIENKSESFSPYSCKKIRVDSTYISVSVKSGNVKDIEVEYSVRENEDFTFEIQDEVLIIKYQDNRKWYEHIGFFFGVSRMTVTVPAANKYEYDIRVQSGSINLENLTSDGKISADSSSGSVSVEEISAEALELSASSGSISLKSSKATETKLGTSSVSINVEYLEGESLSANSSSGSVKLKSVNEKTVNAKSTGGSQKYENLKTNVFDAECTSGSIKGDSVLIRERGSFECVSGSINFKLKNNPDGYSITASSSSGGVHCPEDSEGNVKIKAKATSGSIRFEIE